MRHMLPRLEGREAPARVMVYLSPVVAIALTAGVSALIFWSMGRNPWTGLTVLFLSPLSSVYNLSELALKATPLLLCGEGIALGVRGNVWNIGAEGQFTIGAIAGGGLALAVGSHGSWWLVPTMLIAGTLGGMAWAAIPAFLKTRFNAHEILTTLMLSYVAIQFLGYLVHGPWRDPHGYNFPQSKQFAPDAMMPLLISGTRLHIGFLIALGTVPLVSLILRRTFLGFQIRVVGLAPNAARYAGFSQARTVWFCLLFSGALAGLAGIFEVAGPIGQLQPVISPGYGFAAIIVAFLGRLDPWGVLFASFLMALIYLGGDDLQIVMQMPLAITDVIQGLLLFFVLGTDLLVSYRLRWRTPEGKGI